MKKAFLCVLLASVGAMTGCIKNSTDSAVKDDGSTTVKFSIAYLTHTMDSFKKAPDNCSCWRVYQIHENSIPVARRALDAFESAFDSRKVSDQWSKLGLTVTNAAVSDSDGWRILNVEATTPSIADYDAKLAAAMKAAPPDEYITLIPWYLHTRKFLPRLPSFHKTADPTVVKAVIPVSDVGSELSALTQLTEEERTKLTKQLNYLRNMRQFDEGELKVRVKLPGTITSVENAKQEGTDTVVFDLKGPNVDPDTVSNQAKAKGTITAMLKIDPKTFKIPLQD